MVWPLYFLSCLANGSAGAAGSPAAGREFPMPAPLDPDLAITPAAEGTTNANIKTDAATAVILRLIRNFPPSI